MTRIFILGLVLCLSAAAAQAADKAADLAPVALNSLSSPPPRIAAATVYDQHGKRIGHVRGVVTDASGKPSALSYVAGADGRLVVVAAPQASYDAAANVVVTQSAPDGLASN